MTAPGTISALSPKPMLDRVASPADLRALPDRDLPQLADELRREVIEVVARGEQVWRGESWAPLAVVTGISTRSAHGKGRNAKRGASRQP